MHSSIARHTRLMLLCALLAVLVPLCAVPLAVEFSQILKEVDLNSVSRMAPFERISAHADAAVAYLWIIDSVISPFAYMIVMPRYKEGILDILSTLCCCCRERVNGLRSTSMRHLDTSGSGSVAHDEFIRRMARKNSERTSTVRSQRSQTSEVDMESAFSSCVQSEDDQQGENSHSRSIVPELPPISAASLAGSLRGKIRPVPPFSSLTPSRRIFSNFARVPTLSDCLANQHLEAGDHDTVKPPSVESKSSTDTADHSRKTSAENNSVFVAQVATLQIPSDDPTSEQTSEFSVSLTSSSSEGDLDATESLPQRRTSDSTSESPPRSPQTHSHSSSSRSSSGSESLPSNARVIPSRHVATTSFVLPRSREMSTTSSGTSAGSRALSRSRSNTAAAAVDVSPSSRSRAAQLSPAPTLSLTRDTPSSPTSTRGTEISLSPSRAGSPSSVLRRALPRLSFSRSRNESSRSMSIVEIDVEVTATSMSKNDNSRGGSGGSKFLARSPRPRTRLPHSHSSRAQSKLVNRSRTAPVVSPPATSPLRPHPSRSVTAFPTSPTTNASDVTMASGSRSRSISPVSLSLSGTSRSRAEPGSRSPVQHQPMLGMTAL